MIVNLLKKNQMYSLTLPSKVNGQFWLMDSDENNVSTRLISIEAVEGAWVLKSNSKAKIIDAEGKQCDACRLSLFSFFFLRNVDSDEKMIIFTEPIDKTRQTLMRVVAREPAVFNIGRDKRNHFCFDNCYVSSIHAQLSFDGEAWSIADCKSRNGTFVNWKKITSTKLFPGDCIYIMGLKIIVGSNYVAINNPDEKLSIHSGKLAIGRTQRIEEKKERKIEPPENNYYFRSPTFHRAIEHKTIKIDSPPQPERVDGVPLALMLGPSLTMGFTSLSTGMISAINAAQTGNMAAALPTIMMSSSMLLGTVLWPILTKRYEKKARSNN